MITTFETAEHLAKARRRFFGVLTGLLVTCIVANLGGLAWVFLH